jgi:hypothetical protein
VAKMNLNSVIVCIVLVATISPIASNTMFEEIKTRTLSLYSFDNQSNVSISDIENNFSENLWQEKDGFFVNQTINIETTRGHLNIETKYRLFFVLNNLTILKS